jgi:hypothetical protein
VKPEEILVNSTWAGNDCNDIDEKLSIGWREVREILHLNIPFTLHTPSLDTRMFLAARSLWIKDLTARYIIPLVT